MPKPSPLVEVTAAAPRAGAEELRDAPPAREDRCRNLSPDLQARLEDEIAARLSPALTAILARPAAAIADPARRAVADFFALYEDRPVRDNKGGGLINDSLCLYLVARLAAPALIVESGSYRGHSAWLLRRACPQAEIHSIDIDLGQLRHREPDVRYHEGDWSDVALPAPEPERALVWFDDHVSHALRLRQAHDRGFRRALFDDNFPAYTLYATGGVPAPTLAMITDERLAFGTELQWMRHGKTYRYRYEKSHLFGVDALLAETVPLPDLTAVTRYSPPSGMTYVRLHDAPAR